MTDTIKSPNHYALIENYEVKDINKALLDRIEESDFDISLYEAGWYQQSMQYFMRFYAKGGLEDLEKGVQTMQFVVDSLKERSNDTDHLMNSPINKQRLLESIQQEKTYKLYPESDS